MLQVHIGDSRFLSQLPECSLIQSLVFVDETTGDGEPPNKRWGAPLYEQYFENPGLNGENDYVNCDLHNGR